MNRRSFVVTSLGAVLAWPFTAEAQPTTKLHRIGILLQDGAPPDLLEQFRERLLEVGYVEGKNVIIELRDAGGKNERLGALADELLRLKVDIIFALNTPSAQAAKQATGTIPIVIARVTDPVRAGLVASLAHPGGNITGLSFNNSQLAPKIFQLLKEVLVGISRVAVMSNANNPGHAPQIAAMRLLSARLNLTFLSIPVRDPSDASAAFQAARRGRAEALVVLDDTAITGHRTHILQLAATHSLPVISRYKDFAEAGGLIAYGPSLRALYRRAADYVDRVLKGAKPSDLPLEEPT
jgi:putative tryptophan/tyrosine transport system substrate-binding protein